MVWIPSLRHPVQPVSLVQGKAGLAKKEGLAAG